jgi:hypothetical protein
MVYTTVAYDLFCAIDAYIRWSRPASLVQGMPLGLVEDNPLRVAFF